MLEPHEAKAEDPSHVDGGTSKPHKMARAPGGQSFGSSSRKINKVLLDYNPKYKTQSCCLLQEALPSSPSFGLCLLGAPAFGAICAD